MSVGLAAGAIFAGYRIESRLGQGGMGVVYLAWDPKLERRVALKVLSPPQALAEDSRFRQRFIHESKRAASLGHPNVIPVFEAGESDGLLYLAMQYVEGVDLKALLEHEGPLEARRCLSIVRQVASALDAARTKDLVHRDVKPANIMIVSHGESEADDQVYLLDFGLTKQTGSASGLTGTGEFVGTLDYVAPEQIEGKHVDGRADVYALGCVLYECLTGNRPYLKDDDVAVMYAHLSEPVPPVTATRKDLPPAINAVIAKATAKSRDARYPSAGALAGAAASALQVAAIHGSKVPIGAEETRVAEPPALGGLPGPTAATTLPQFPAKPSTDLPPTSLQPAATLPTITRQSGLSRPRADQTVAPPMARTAPATAPQMDRSVRWRGRYVPMLLLLVSVLTAITIGVIAASMRQGELTSVADVAGVDSPAAVDRLGQAKLQPQPVSEPNCAVPSGKVIRTAPAAGSRVRIGSAVQVIVSGGPDVTVPNLVGLDRKDAEAKLQALNLKPAASTEDSNDVPARQVIRADPTADARACHGSVVQVIVSKDIPFKVPTDVVRAYIQAINRKDYTSAYALFGPALRSRQTPDGFRAGFAGTTTDQVLELSDRGTGPNGTTVHIRFIAHQVDGSTRTFSGTYTVGRVDSHWALLGASIIQE